MLRRRIHPRKGTKEKGKILFKKGKKRTKYSRGWIVWRSLKGIISICCLALFFYQSASFLKIYYNYPTTTKIEFTHPDEFELPAFTFCNTNYIKRSKFCAEYPNLCHTPQNITTFCRKYPFICQDNSSNPVIPRFGIPPDGDFPSELVDAIREIYFSGNITKEFWEDWTWSIEYNNWMKPTFMPLPPAFFPCYSGNLFLNSTAEPVKIPLDSIFQGDSFLVYDLIVPRSEEFFYFWEPEVYLSIHSPFVPVDPFLGRRLKLGYKYNIFIRQEEEQLLPYPYRTDCTNYTDLWIKNNDQGPRSQQMCKELCLYDLLERSKNVTPEFRLLEYPLEICLDKDCETSPEDRKYLESCKRNCKVGCRNLKYASTIVETALANSKKDIREYGSEMDVIKVEIFLGDRQVVVERHVPVYDTGHLFSYIGGLMGCWLGVSIWAFAGIAENVFLRSLQWTEKIKKYLKGASPDIITTFPKSQNKMLNMNVW